MILSTTNTIEGKKAVKYLGLVSGDAILGANIFRDFFRVHSGISLVVDRRPMRRSCARRRISPLEKCVSRPRTWVPMRLSALTSIMKPSAPTAACSW